MSKEDRATRRTEDLKALASFITPVNLKVREKVKPSSLAEVSESKSKKAIIDKIIHDSNTHGSSKAQASIYEELLSSDLTLANSKSKNLMSDTEYFLKISKSLKCAGLFNTAKSIELLLAKTKLVQPVSRVFASKKAREARIIKDETVTPQALEELNQYKEELKAWALKKYYEDCQSKQLLGEPKRPKRAGDLAANDWLLSMAEEDLMLNMYDPSTLSNEFIEKLTVEGNFHGSPEQPDNLLDFKLSRTFFYQCLKE